MSVPEESLDKMLTDPVFENRILIKRQRLGILQRRSGELAQLIGQAIELIDRDAARLGPAS